MDWLRDGANWPNREHSNFIVCNRTRWHIQTMGLGQTIGPGQKTERRQGLEQKPQMLLLHGSGATTHSYAELLPILAEQFSVTAIDLPGHGFTSPLGNGKPTLPRIAEAVSAFMQQEDIQPDIIVGHSAGAAIGVQSIATGGLKPKAIVSINGAFYPFPGLAGSMFPLAAKLLFLNPIVPKLFSFTAGNFGRIESLIDSTGSKLNKEGLALYQKAMLSSDHVNGTLAMMANWDLEPMRELLSNLTIPMLQIIGMRDGTISPSTAVETANLLKHGSRLDFRGKGHLVHEELPEEVAAAISDFALETLEQS